METVESNKVKFTLTRRQKLLLPVVVTGSFFEGFDFMVINLALPFISKEFAINAKTTGFIISTVAIGALLAFFMVRLADRFGRRPIFLASVTTYALLSLLTACVPSLFTFVACQLLARIFLVSSWAVGFIIMTEEFIPELRGRAIGLFQSLSAIGAIFPSVIMMFSSSLGIGWRGLYVIGGLPLLVILFLGKNLPETEHFLDLKSGKKEQEERPPVLAIFEKPYRKHIIAVMGLWFFMYMCYATSMNFFSYRVVNELGFTSGQVGTVMAIAYTLGLSGYLVVGKLLDAIGRKKTAFIFMGMGCIAVICTFQATQYLQVLIAQTIGVFFVGTFTVLCATFTNELFPTAIRANATAWGNNIVGRVATIAAPSLVGIIQGVVGGIGNAVSITALSMIVCIVIIAVFLPEPMRYKVPEYTFKPGVKA